MIIIVNAEKEIPSCYVQTQSEYLIRFLTSLGYEQDFPPLGALLAPTYGVVGSAFIASPIHWEASHNDVMITAYGEALQLPESLAKIWFYELVEFFAHDGFQLTYYNQDNWLIVPPEAHVLKAPRAAAMLNRSIMPILSEIGESLYWQRLMTEIQMFMSQHPLNQQKNQPITVNGLWFWGAGCLDKPVHQPIYTDSAIIRNAFPSAKPLDMLDFSDREAIVVMEQYDAALLAHYEKKLRHQTVRWVWNQHEYTTRAHWFYRMWSSFCR